MMVFSELVCYKTLRCLDGEEAMIKDFKTYALVTLLIGIAVVTIEPTVWSQDFPYLAPEAPEFDSRGNALEKASRRPLSEAKHSERRTPTNENLFKSEPTILRPNAFQEGFSIGTGPLSSPQAPIYGSSSESSRKTSSPIPYASFPTNSTERMRSPTPASTASGTPTQIQDRSDCSEYPILIASARSETEMQFAARRYLTCLMQKGWNLNQARQQVISAIENTYRVSR